MPKSKKIRVEVTDYHGITLGMIADAVLEQTEFHRAKMVQNPKILGRDDEGLVVEWHYKGVILTMARPKNTGDANEIIAYAVQKIEERQAVDGHN